MLLSVRGVRLDGTRERDVRDAEEAEVAAQAAPPAQDVPAPSSEAPAPATPDESARRDA
jgi:hypothetical protein